MKFKKSQSGRSMVEMLGVLAIIGVLSVGGIAGYTLSMRKHRANGVADLASKYALTVYSQCVRVFLDGKTCFPSDISEFVDSDLGTVPAGVDTIYVGDLYFTQEEGVNTVVVGVNFTDPKLCQAYASISGSTCVENGSTYRTLTNFNYSY